MNGRVLLVDDEPAILRSLQRLFRAERYEIHTATSGAAALELLQQHSVDLIISDMRMPFMSGAEFLTEARKRYPDTVRILLTGYSDMASTVAAINDGGIFGYLTKPWDADQLKALVSQALQLRSKSVRQKRVLVGLKKDQERLKTCIDRQMREMNTTEQYVSEVYKKLNDSYVLMEHTLLNLLELRFPGHRQMSSIVGAMVEQLAVELALAEVQRDQLRVAAMLFGVGKISLPDHIIGQPVDRLDDRDACRYECYPRASSEALVSMPRYVEVAEVIVAHKAYLNSARADAVVPGTLSRVLMVAVDYAEYAMGWVTGEALDHEAALRAMAVHSDRYDPAILKALAGVPVCREDELEHYDIMLPVKSLFEGMVLKRDLLSTSGSLLLRAGVRLDQTLIDQLHRMQRNVRERLILNVCFDSERVELVTPDRRVS